MFCWEQVAKKSCNFLSDYYVFCFCQYIFSVTVNRDFKSTNMSNICLLFSDEINAIMKKFSLWNPIWLELKYIPQILFSILIPILFQFDAKLAKYYGKHFILMTLETVHCAKLFLKNIPHYFRCNHNRQYDFPGGRWWVP